MHPCIVEQFLDDLDHVYLLVKKYSTEITTAEVVSKVIDLYHFYDIRKAKPISREWVEKGKSIRKMRLELGLTQQQVGDMIGVCGTAVGRAELWNQSNRTSKDTQQRIYRLLIELKKKAGA
jgi:threonyl-tRNA synthetase